MQKIMFIDPLEKSVMRGDKTMTRRIITVPRRKVDGKDAYGFEVWKKQGIPFDVWITGENDETLCQLEPRFKVGEIVALAQRYRDIRDIIGDVHDGKSIKFMQGWWNKMFVKADLMPHQIKITDIGIDRLQDISDGDCLREGILARHDVIDTQMRDVIRYQYPDTPHLFKTPKEAFAHLIDKVSRKGTWASNPFVFVYSFKLIK